MNTTATNLCTATFSEDASELHQISLDNFDAVRLSLRSQDHEDLSDCLDFSIDGDGDDKFFSDSSHSMDLIETMFADTNMSGDIVSPFIETPNQGTMGTDILSIIGSMNINVKQESQSSTPSRKRTQAQSNYVSSSSSSSSSRRRRNKKSSSRARPSVNPTPYDHQQYQRLSRAKMNSPSFTKATGGEPQAKRQRRVSLESGMAPDLSQFGDIIARRRRSANTHDLQYNQVYQKLAQSMERTDLSRRQLLMQRAAIRSPEPTPSQQQQQVTTSAQQKLHYRVANSGIASDRNSVIADFFSGSRNTLTHGLENSRRQLKMYANQCCNSQMF